MWALIRIPWVLLPLIFIVGFVAGWIAYSS
jgi:hypothetical protein